MDGLLLRIMDWWVYALGNNGKKLIPSQIKVDYTDNPNEINPNIEKGIKPDPHQLIDNSPIPNLQLTRSDTFYSSYSCGISRCRCHI